MIIEDTLKERGARYGDFATHASVAMSIKAVIADGDGGRLSDVQRHALDVIADKIARILCGDPNYADNWHDIQGYARLVEKNLLDTE